MNSVSDFGLNARTGIEGDWQLYLVIPR